MKNTIVQILSKGMDGGVEAIVMNYCKLLSPNFHFVFLIENESKIINRKTIQDINGELVIVPSYTHLFRYNRFLKAFFKSRKDIKIVHSNLSTLSFLPLRQAQKAGIPIRISESHSTESQNEFFRSILKRFFRHLTNFYLTDCFACSKLAASFQYGNKRLNSGEIFILPNAIDTKRFVFSESMRNILRKELGLRPSDFVIGHIGRFAKQKNHRFLIKLLNQIKDPSVKLVLIGKGNLKQEIKNECYKLGIENQVIFVDSVANIQDYYNIFDVFCLPSLYEGLPVVSIEAQTNGLPTLLADTITKECSLLDTTQFLSLSSISSWINAINDIRIKKRQNRTVNLINFRNYDINIQKEKLISKYNELLFSRIKH